MADQSRPAVLERGSGTGPRLPVSWPRSCRSLSPGSRDTCGCCVRPGSSRSGRTPNDASTAFDRSPLPTSRVDHPLPRPVEAAAGGLGHRDIARAATTKEHSVSSDGTRHNDTLVGSVSTLDGAGVVHIERRDDTAIDDVWSAIVDPEQLARWYDRVEGDLRAGGRFRTRLDPADIDATGRAAACEPPRRLLWSPPRRPGSPGTEDPGRHRPTRRSRPHSPARTSAPCWSSRSGASR